MPIMHAQVADCKRAGMHWVTLPCEVVRVLAASPDALAMYALLLTQDATWVLREAHIRKELKLSRERYRSAIRVLKAQQLLVDDQPRENGRFRALDRCLHAIPAVLDYSTTEIPRGGICTSLSKDQLTKKRSTSITKRSTRERTLEEDLSDKSWVE